LLTEEPAMVIAVESRDGAVRTYSSALLAGAARLTETRMADVPVLLTNTFVPMP
jgi:hypothetical protein